MFEADMSLWQGRSDAAEGPNALRWHERIAPWTNNAPPGIAILGFACDDGVRRNQGRPGAAAGPGAIRRTLANLAWRQAEPVYDAGDVVCRDHDLEGAQERLASAVSTLLLAGHRPLVLGGGHETALGVFRGLVRTHPSAVIGVVNLDAHFDLRSGEPSSGTPFAQMAEWCSAHGRPFRYSCLGVSEPANTQALFERAEALGVSWSLDSELSQPRLAYAVALLEAFIHNCDALYFSLDLDVLPAATMPAVSAPAYRGVPLEIVETLLEVASASGKLAVADVVELNPTFDPDGRGARVAAGLVWKLARRWIRPTLK
jgi:formiminoglutamase